MRRAYEFTIAVTNVDESPEIILAQAPLKLPTHGKKPPVDTTAFIRDVDTPTITVANATLQVKVAQNGTPTDKIRLLKPKNEAFAINGKDLFYRHAYLQHKKGQVPLTVHFNSSATKEAIEAVLHKVYYKTKGTVGATRKLEFSLSDLEGNKTSKSIKNVELT